MLKTRGLPTGTLWNVLPDWDQSLQQGMFFFQSNQDILPLRPVFFISLTAVSLLHFLEVHDGVFGPVDVADDATGQLVHVRVVVLWDGEQERKHPDHTDDHFGLRGREPLFQRVDDGHVPAKDKKQISTAFTDAGSEVRLKVFWSR